MRRNRRKFLQIASALTALLTLTLLLLLSLAWWDQEPIVAGKPVSFWIGELDQQPYERQVIATEHLKSTGPGVSGYLIEALRQDQSLTSRSRGYYRQIWAKTPAPVRRWLPQPKQFRTDRGGIVTALSEVAPTDPAAVDQIILDLRDKDKNVRFYAASALARMKANVVSRVVPALVHSLTNDGAGNVRGRAAFSLSEIGEPAKLAIPALIAALGDPDPEARWLVAKALGTLAEGNVSAVEAIGKRLADPDPVTRIYLAQAHYKLTGKTEPAVGILVSILEAGDNDGRLVAASVLAVFGPPAKAALSALRVSVADPDLGVSVFSAHALWTIGGDTDRALPALQNVLTKSEGYYQIKAAEFLGKLGGAAFPAVQDLLKATASGDFQVRLSAIVALGKIGATAASAIPQLKELADSDPVPSVRTAAQKSVEQISSVVPAAESQK